MTLRENLTHQFHCRSEGWDPHNRPLITWYLNGKWQKEQPSNRGRLVMTSESDSEVINLGHNHNSTLPLRPRTWNRELVCVASNPRTGERYNATITLSLQCESSSRRPLFSPETVNKSVAFLCQSSQRSSGWTPTTARRRTPDSLWSCSPWYGPTHLQPSPS